MKVLCVCVNGMGSSLILHMSVEKACKQLGIDASVDHCDLGGYGSQHPDIVITTPSLASSLPAREGVKVVTIKNFVDVEGIKQAMSAALDLQN